MEPHEREELKRRLLNPKPAEVELMLNLVEIQISKHEYERKQIATMTPTSVKELFAALVNADSQIYEEVLLSRFRRWSAQATEDMKTELSELMKADPNFQKALAEKMVAMRDRKFELP